MLPRNKNSKYPKNDVRERRDSVEELCYVFAHHIVLLTPVNAARGRTPPTLFQKKKTIEFSFCPLIAILFFGSGKKRLFTINGLFCFSPMMNFLSPSFMHQKVYEKHNNHRDDKDVQFDSWLEIVEARKGIHLVHLYNFREQKERTIPLKF